LEVKKEETELISIKQLPGTHVPHKTRLHYST